MKPLKFKFSRLIRCPFNAPFSRLFLGRFGSLFLTRSVTVLMLSFALGCSDYSSDTAGLSSNVNTALTCNVPSEDLRKPSKTGLKRMSPSQFKNTYEDLFSNFLSGTEVNGLLSVINFDEIPNNNDDDMSILDQSVSPIHIEAYMNVATSAINHILASSTLKNKVFGSCHTNTSDDTCVNTFINDFGFKAHRQPLSVQQQTNYKDIFNLDKAKGYENLLFVFLNTPFFIYRIELGTEELQYGYAKLTPFELASKLSYLYLRSMPDDTLLNKAANNQLKTKEQIEAEIDRLLSLPKTRNRLVKAFARQWLKTEDTPDVLTSSPAVQDMLSTLKTTVDPVELKNSIVQETHDYLDFHIWENKSSFQELMTSELVFPRSPALAEIYGTSVWPGDYKSLVKAPSGERAGVLTQAHYLFTGKSSTRPIMRGVNFYKRFYCGSMPSPADNAAPEDIVIKDDFSEREKVTAMTEHPESACITCHQPIINPIGFSFENFDSLGRFRVQESIYADDLSAEKGTVIAQKEVNNNTTVFLQGMQSEISVRKPADFVKNIVKTDQVEACFAKTVWKFAVAEPLSENEDSCASLGLLSPSSSSFNKDLSVYEILKNIGLQPEFNSKRIY